MNYQISEDEFYRLEGVRDQLGLIAGLVAGADTSGALDCITGSQLHAFVDGLRGIAAGIIAAAQVREQARFDTLGSEMSWGDWMHALRIARGDALHAPKGAETIIGRKLSAMARINADMSRVLDEWNRVLECADKPSHTPAAPAVKTPAKPRKRERLAANA